MATEIAAEFDAATPIDTLVRSAQRGDKQALGALAERFERLVYGIALRRLGNHVEAQEIVQEVFLQVLRKIGQVREPASIAGWLRAITARRISNRITRHGRVGGDTGGALDSALAEDLAPPAQAIERERQSQVREGLQRLGTVDRQTLVAFYVDGQSLSEMSTAFASPVGTIKRRLHVARKRLARELESVM